MLYKLMSTFVWSISFNYNMTPPPSINIISYNKDLKFDSMMKDTKSYRRLQNSVGNDKLSSWNETTN